MANASLQGERLLAGLLALQNAHENIGDVRGKGLMAAIELVKDRDTKESHPELRDAIIQAAFRKGLLLLGCGQSSIRFCPPLTVMADAVDVCLSLLKDAVQAAGG